MPGCVRSASTSPGRSASMRSSVSRPGSRGNVISPRLPDAITETSGISSSGSFGVIRSPAAVRIAWPVAVSREASSATPAFSDARPSSLRASSARTAPPPWRRTTSSSVSP